MTRVHRLIAVAVAAGLGAAACSSGGDAVSTTTVAATTTTIVPPADSDGRLVVGILLFNRIEKTFMDTV